GAAQPGAELRALERRARGRRGRPEAVARAEEHLAVGPDVYRDANLGALVDAGRQGDGDGVGADEARDERQEAHARLGGDLQEELARREDERVTHHGRVGGEPDVGGVDAEEEVVHARVADDDDLVDPLGQHARLAADRPPPPPAAANVVTVTPAGSSRSAPGNPCSTARPTSAGVTPRAAASCSRSEVWWCSSRGRPTFTTCFRIPESSVTRPIPTTPGPAPRI